jgi:hypothetical protein
MEKLRQNSTKKLEAGMADGGFVGNLWFVCICTLATYKCLLFLNTENATEDNSFAFVK